MTSLRSAVCERVFSAVQSNSPDNFLDIINYDPQQASHTLSRSTAYQRVHWRRQSLCPWKRLYSKNQHLLAHPLLKGFIAESHLVMYAVPCHPRDAPLSKMITKQHVAGNIGPFFTEMALLCWKMIGTGNSCIKFHIYCMMAKWTMLITDTFFR